MAQVGCLGLASGRGLWLVHDHQNRRRRAAAFAAQLRSLPEDHRHAQCCNRSAHKMGGFRGASSLRSARRCYRPRHRHPQGGLARLAARRRCCADRARQAGGARVVRCHRARPPYLEAAEGRAGAGAEPGGGGRRADQPGARLPGHVPGARPRGGADPADARRHRGTYALSQRAPHHRDAARSQGRAGRQRERHRGDDRDPLRRQRPPVGARCFDGVGRLPRAAVRHRRPLHRTAQRQRQCDAPRRRQRHHSRDRSHGGRRRHRAVEGRHAHQGRGGEDRARRRHAHGDRQRQGAEPAALDRRRCAVHLVPRPLRSDDGTKRWISGQLEPKGYVYVDAGAVTALAAGKSLLPAGVKRVEGRFDRGDAVVIRAPDGHELGRGLIAYASIDAERIIGRKSSEIATILGVSRCDELIHRDDMALHRK